MMLRRIEHNYLKR